MSYNFFMKYVAQADLYLVYVKLMMNLNLQFSFWVLWLKIFANIDFLQS